MFLSGIHEPRPVLRVGFALSGIGKKLLANPAAALHAILSQWKQDSSKQIYTHRGISAGGNDSDMRRHRQAIALINEIDQILGSIERPQQRQDAHNRVLGRLTKWVMAYPHNWLDVPRKESPNLNDQDTLDYLDSIAALLDNYVPTYDAAERDRFSRILDKVVDALIEDDTLPDELRRHMHLLIAEARRCIEEYEITGDFKLQSAMERLSATVSTATKCTKKPSKWSAFRDNFVWPSAVGLAVASPQLMLTMGAGGA